MITNLLLHVKITLIIVKKENLYVVDIYSYVIHMLIYRDQHYEMSSTILDGITDRGVTKQQKRSCFSGHSHL